MSANHQSHHAEPIRFTVTPQLRDFVRFQAYHSIRQVKLLFIIAVFLLVVFACAPFMPYQKSTTALEAYRSSVGVLILPAIVFLLLPATIWFSSYRRWQSAPEVREPRQYTFSDRGIEVKAATFSSKFDWTNIREAPVVKGLLLLITAQRAAYIIPLGDAGRDADRLLVLVDHKLQSSKR